jgi:hypothetical protein
MQPAGTLATGTITMPAAPADGMTITFSSTRTITALTVNANTGQSIVSAPTVLPANQVGAYVYRLSNTTWYPFETVPTNVPVAPAGGSIITSGTVVASTSGTSIDFTGLPSWIKRITVMFSAVSTSGTVVPLIQIGAGSITSSGYISSSMYMNTAAASSNVQYTTGFGINQNQAAGAIYGAFTLSLVNSATNAWVLNGGAANSSSAAAINISSGGVSLGGTLDRVRITTLTGVDTFDAGTINIMYEG